MSVNRGKQFEDNLKKQFEQVPDTLCLRLYDVTTGFKNQNNPCDFVVFRDGTLNLFECKAIHGNTLNFKSHIKDNQWEKLSKYDKLPAVNGGIICWFIDADITLFIPMWDLNFLKEHGYKSFNINDLDSPYYNTFINFTEIAGIKKRVFFEYNLEKFMEDISYE